jgi:ComF family protein
MIRVNKCSFSVRYFIFVVHTCMIRITNVIRHFTDIVFPVICVCCGCSTGQRYKYICEWCENERFEPAQEEKNEIYPEFIRMQYSLWNFDKGGYLQQLLHDLKYGNLRGVGEELGHLLGKKFCQSCPADLATDMENMKPILVPVPLYRTKRRKRGFNQARVICNGLNFATNWNIVGSGTIIRIKSTKTQTGLNLAQRSVNLKNAFKIIRNHELKGAIPVIVDDVFTTGATTFELAKTLADAGAAKSVILTVAKA